MAGNFAEWVRGEMSKRGMGQVDLARLAHVSPGAISKLLNGERNPGVDVCRGIAKAFELAEDVVLERAGLLTRNNVSLTTAAKELLAAVQFLSEEEILELIALAEFKRRKRGVHAKGPTRT